MQTLALRGAQQLITYFIDAARQSHQLFIAGPVWNQADSLFDGATQYLRYAFDRVNNREAAFLTTELEKYGAGDPATKALLEQKVNSLLE